MQIILKAAALLVLGVRGNKSAVSDLIEKNRECSGGLRGHCRLKRTGKRSFRHQARVTVSGMPGSVENH